MGALKIGKSESCVLAFYIVEITFCWAWTARKYVDRACFRFCGLDGVLLWHQYTMLLCHIGCHMPSVCIWHRFVRLIEQHICSPIKAVPSCLEHAHCPIHDWLGQWMGFIRPSLLVILRVSQGCHQPRPQGVATVTWNNLDRIPWSYFSTKPTQIAVQRPQRKLQVTKHNAHISLKWGYLTQGQLVS